jgi:hypothetical protein
MRALQFLVGATSATGATGATGAALAMVLAR